MPSSPTLQMPQAGQQSKASSARNLGQSHSTDDVICSKSVAARVGRSTSALGNGSDEQNGLSVESRKKKTPERISLPNKPEVNAIVPFNRSPPEASRKDSMEFLYQGIPDICTSGGSLETEIGQMLKVPNCIPFHGSKGSVKIRNLTDFSVSYMVKPGPTALKKFEVSSSVGLISAGDEVQVTVETTDNLDWKDAMDEEIVVFGTAAETLERLKKPDLESCWKVYCSVEFPPALAEVHVIKDMYPLKPKDFQIFGIIAQSHPKSPSIPADSFHILYKLNDDLSDLTTAEVTYKLSQHLMSEAIREGDIQDSAWNWSSYIWVGSLIVLAVGAFIATVDSSLVDGFLKMVALVEKWDVFGFREIPPPPPQEPPSWSDFFADMWNKIPYLC